MSSKTIIYIMGVSGSGKSTIGQLLAKTLEVPFFDGDDYHPTENVQKMAAGIPLNDDDRKGWLLTLNKLAQQQRTEGAVIACSALKQSYRNLLGAQLTDETAFVYLAGSFEQIASRLKSRENHFMPPHLLRSQFEALEPPQDAIVVSVEDAPEDMVTHICKALESS